MSINQRLKFHYQLLIFNLGELLYVPLSALNFLLMIIDYCKRR